MLNFHLKLMLIVMKILSSQSFEPSKKIPDTNYILSDPPTFPYEFWKPKSNRVDHLHGASPILSNTKQSYGYYYGEPISHKIDMNPSTWNVLPIKLPKDVVGEVNEKSTINPLKDITTHPSYIFPQYGRHPGATERPPLYFPSKFAFDEGSSQNQKQYKMTNQSLKLSKMDSHKTSRPENSNERPTYDNFITKAKRKLHNEHFGKNKHQHLGSENREQNNLNPLELSEIEQFSANGDQNNLLRNIWQENKERNYLKSFEWPKNAVQNNLQPHGWSGKEDRNNIQPHGWSANAERNNAKLRDWSKNAKRNNVQANGLSENAKRMQPNRWSTNAERRNVQPKELSEYTKRKNVRLNGWSANAERNNFYQRENPDDRPSKFIEIVNIDRNHESPPHAFYPIQNSHEWTMEVLHKNKSHMTYKPINFDNRIRNPVTRKTHPIRQPINYSSSREGYDILDYNRYQLQKDVNPPQVIRKHFNENLVDLIRKKIESKTGRQSEEQVPVYPSIRNPNLKPKSQQTIASSKHKLREPNLSTRHSLADSHKYLSTMKNATNFNKYYKEPSLSSNFPKTLINKYFQTTTSKPLIPLSQNHQTYNQLSINPASRLKQFLQNGLRKTKFAPNSPATVSPKHYLLYYHSQEDDTDYGLREKSIFERISDIQNTPATLMIPGGLAALGLGLAYYYFNYIWYPTPIVTARLSQLLLGFTNEVFGPQEQNEVGKVLNVFRGIESDYQNNEISSESCRNRLVCQLHHDIPNLWEVTQVLLPILSTQLETKSSDDTAFEDYLTMAEKGHYKDTSCEILHISCHLPYLPLQSLLNSLFKGSSDKDAGYGESRVL